MGGFKSGPTGLGLGEAQGHEKEPQVVLGREDDVLRLIALNALKGCLVGCEEENVLGLRPEVVGVAGEGYSTRPESSVPNSRASEESSIGKAREERGDEDPLEGISRATFSLEALEVVKRATFTKEALFAEASRYVDSPLFFVGGRDLSSFTPSRFRWVVVKGGEGGVSRRVSLRGWWRGAEPAQYYFG